VELAKTDAVAIPGPLDVAVSGDGFVRYLRSPQISDLAPVRIGAQGQLRLLGHSDTIGSLAGSGIVELLGGSLVTGNDNTSTTYAGVISGIGGTVTKVGTNSFTLSGNNAYTGPTFVKGGTLIVLGQQPQSDVTIETGGTLGGHGAVGVIGDLSGHIQPGTYAPGLLKCGGFLTQSPANRLHIEINGTTPGVNCDQLDVAGAVSLMGGTLQLAMNFSGAVSNEYVIIKNDGADAVTGTFMGLPQDATFTNQGVVFQIDYQGGDGNDVVLIQQSLEAGPQMGGVHKLSDGTVQIVAAGQPNATYVVEATESLKPPVIWANIGQASANGAGQITFVDADAPPHPIRFYRFRKQE
jgi:autotransporter-associated beta strand protein